MAVFVNIVIVIIIFIIIVVIFVVLIIINAINITFTITFIIIIIIITFIIIVLIFYYFNNFLSFLFEKENSETINVIHVNIRCLSKKFDNLLDILRDSNCSFNIHCITETWYTDSTLKNN